MKSEEIPTAANIVDFLEAMEGEPVAMKQAPASNSLVLCAMSSEDYNLLEHSFVENVIYAEEALNPPPCEQENAPHAEKEMIAAAKHAGNKLGWGLKRRGISLCSHIDGIFSRIDKFGAAFCAGQSNKYLSFFVDNNNPPEYSKLLLCVYLKALISAYESKEPGLASMLLALNENLAEKAEILRVLQEYKMRTFLVASPSPSAASDTYRKRSGAPSADEEVVDAPAPRYARISP